MMTAALLSQGGLPNKEESAVRYNERRFLTMIKKQ
jgi:hypothetical protein